MMRIEDAYDDTDHEYDNKITNIIQLLLTECSVRQHIFFGGGRKDDLHFFL